MGIKLLLVRAESFQKMRRMEAARGYIHILNHAIHWLVLKLKPIKLYIKTHKNY